MDPFPRFVVSQSESAAAQASALAPQSQYRAPVRLVVVQVNLMRLQYFKDLCGRAMSLDCCWGALGQLMNLSCRSRLTTCFKHVAKVTATFRAPILHER